MSSEATAFEVSAAILRVERLSFSYPASEPVLADVSFSIADGERVAIVGPSGAGKSTLLLHLNGTLPRPAARVPAVEVAGLPASTQNLREIRQLVGLVFQDPDDQLFCPTVAEDIAFGPLNFGCAGSEVTRRIEESLNAVGLSGYESRRAAQLSQGERKRVCVAAVLACRPAVLALDEPTANLDPRARRTLRKHLDVLPAAQILATHDLDFVVEHCTRVLILDRGRLVAEGSPIRILSDSVLMEQHGLEVPWRLRPK